MKLKILDVPFELINLVLCLFRVHNGLLLSHLMLEEVSFPFERRSLILCVGNFFVDTYQFGHFSGAGS